MKSRRDGCFETHGTENVRTMPTLENLQRRIETAADLRSVVTTMKTLAAVSIRQYELAAESLTEFNRTMELGFQIVLQDGPMWEQRQKDQGPTGAVVFGSDQGMCGQFNEEIVSFVESHRQQDPAGTSWRRLVAGARAENLLQETGWVSGPAYRVPTSIWDIEALIQDLLPQIESWWSQASVTRVLVFHNERTSAASYQPRVLQLLPIDPQQFRDLSARPWPSRSLPSYRMERHVLLSRLIRQFLYVALFRACTESLASENASRIAAMQAAEKNIEERLEELRREFHQQRQTAITEELLEVVSGFEALEQATVAGRDAETARTRET